MNQVAQIETPRTVRFDPDARAYEAFSLASYNGKPETRLLPPLEARTLKDALAEATARWTWDRGDRLAIRELGRNIDVLNIYAVRKSAHGRTVWNGHIPATEHKRWLEHVCAIDLNIIAGIDLIGVGCERGMFENRQQHRPEGARLRR